MLRTERPSRSNPAVLPGKPLASLTTIVDAVAARIGIGVGMILFWGLWAWAIG